MASTGQALTKGRLQPTGRPVMATTERPAALRSASACRASGVIAPSLVSVSSMSVKMPTSAPRADASQRVSGSRWLGEAGREDGADMACKRGLMRMRGGVIVAALFV